MSKLILIITCVALGLFYATSLTAHEKFKAKHPTAKTSVSVGEKMRGIIMAIILCACPILHLLVIGVLLFSGEEIIDRTVEQLEDEIIEE